MCPPPTKSGAAVATEPVPQPVKPRRKPQPVDESASPMRTLFFVALYSVVFGLGMSKVEETGLRFHSEAWMVAMVSWPMVYVAPLLYVVAVMVGCRLMAGRASLRPFLKRYVQPVYNVAQIVICSYMVWGMIHKVDLRNGNPFGLNSDFDAAVEWFIFVHYLTKFMDWCDTLFMILSKSYRQVSFLQVFHHATIGMVWGALLRRGIGSDTTFYGAFINSVTHVIMYTHYLVTSFGIRNPLKRYITAFQLAQFASCYVHAVLVLLYETRAEMAYLSPVQLAYHTIMLSLFGIFMNWSPRWLHGQNISALEKAKAQ